MAADAVAEARIASAALRQEMTNALATVDALITVCTLKTAPPVSDFTEGRRAWTPMRTMAFNLTGHPVLVVPVGLVDGMPIGMQIVGRHGDEAGICAIGHAFERATDHTLQRPRLFGEVYGLAV